MKRRYLELNHFNAIACLLVVFIHVVSIGISNADPSSWQAALLYIPWRLSAFVVPAFLFSGAIKMSVLFSEDFELNQYFCYIGNRVAKIYLPYVLWNIIYYTAFLKIGYVNGNAKEFFSYLLIGNLSSPFYYVVIVMQFYLLYPLWKWVTKCIPGFIAVTCAFVVTLLSLQFGSVLQMVQVSFPYLDRVFTSYLVFWVSGLYVGMYYSSIRKIVVKRKAGICASTILIILLTGVAYWQYSEPVYVLNLVPYKIFSDLLSVFVLLYVSVHIEDICVKVKKILGRVYEASFFVYLSHCLFLTLGTHYMQGKGITKLSVLLMNRFLICYTIPFFAYAAWKRIKKLLIQRCMVSV